MSGRADLRAGAGSRPGGENERQQFEEQFAEVIREALLLPFAGLDRVRHFVAATHMARASSGVILTALEAVRSTAARGEPQESVRSAFVRALSRAAAAADETADDPTGADQIGPDASLLTEAAAEFQARAREAAGVDEDERLRNERIANGLAGLSARHEVWHVGRDALPAKALRSGG